MKALIPPLAIYGKVVLNYKEWSVHLEDYELKLMAVEALNQVLVETTIRLKGYLITSKKIFLIFHQSKEAVGDFFDLFFEKMIKKLMFYARNLNVLEQYLKEEKLLVSELFRIDDFIDFRREGLLTGENIEPAYEDPEFKEMKDLVRNNDYASYHYYFGVKGPILMELNPIFLTKSKNQS